MSEYADVIHVKNILSTKNLDEFASHLSIPLINGLWNPKSSLSDYV